MTVTSQVIQNAYSGNGVTTQWAYTFPVSKADDIKVYITDSGGTTTLLLGLYTVDTDNSIVTYPTPESLLSPLASGYTITLTRYVPVVQETSFAIQGPLSAKTIEAAFDKLTMMMQQISTPLIQLLSEPNGIPFYAQATRPSPDPAAGVVSFWHDTSQNQNYIWINGEWRFLN